MLIKNLFLFKNIFKIQILFFVFILFNSFIYSENIYNYNTIFIQYFLTKIENENFINFSSNSKITFLNLENYKKNNSTMFIKKFQCKDFDSKNENIEVSEFLEKDNNLNHYETIFIKSFFKNLNEKQNEIENFKHNESNKEFLYDEAEKITLKASHVSMDDIKKLIIADGNVITKYKNSTCYSDFLEYKDAEKFSKAKGNVRLYKDNDYIKGQDISYDIKTEKGEVKNAKTFSDIWIITSEKLEKISKEKIIAYNARVTTCDHNHPHYYLKSKKIVVHLNKRFIAYNSILYVKGVPLFYLPIWTQQTFQKKKLTFTIRGGQSNTNGIYEKVKTTYTFDNNNTLSLYTDNYEKRGFGLGLGGNYNFHRTFGSIYLYKIDDLVDMANKETATINHSQDINDNLKLYMNINYQNDESFYKTYYYSGVSSQLEPTGSQVNSNIYSYSSLYYTKDFYYMNLLWEEENNWNLGKYQKAREELPSFSFNTNTNKFFKTGLFYKYNFKIANRYNTSIDDYYKEGNSSFSLSKSQKLTRNITLNPTVSITEKFNELSLQKYTTSWKANLALKTRINSDMDLFTTYIYDAGMFNKKSLNTNKINFSLSSYLLNGNIRITNSTGYNFNLKDYSKNLEKIDPFYTEIKYKINKSLNYYGKHIFDFQAKKTTFLQNIFYFYPSAKLTFVENATFLDSNPDEIDTITTIKIRPNLKWKIDYNYRFLYDYKKNIFHSYSSHEIALLRDLHCFDLKFSYISKSDAEGRYREFWITLRLKAMYDQDISLYKNNKDYKKWYDWDFKNA